MILGLQLCLIYKLVEVAMSSPLDNLLAIFQVERAGGFRRANVLMSHSDPRIQFAALVVLQHQHYYTVKL